MDQTQLQQKIVEYYNKLPSDVQTLFSSMNWLKDLEEISKRYSLSEEQKEYLGTETTLVLLGVIDSKEYNKNLEAEISISADLIQK